MRTLMTTLTLFTCLSAFAQMKSNEVKCTPNPEENGTTSYVCVTKTGLPASKSKPIEAAITSIDSDKEAKEAYALMNTTDSVIFRQSDSVWLKACLADIYMKQMTFHKKKGTYASNADDYGLASLGHCKDLEITSETATKTEFKVIAKKGALTWSVDQTKTIEELR